MSVKTANYVTIAPAQFIQDDWSKKELPAGTFVKPIHPVYLPAHIKSTLVYEWFNPVHEVFVYCSYGIIVIDKKNMREV